MSQFLAMSNPIAIVEPTPRGHNLGLAMERAIRSSSPDSTTTIVTTDRLSEAIDGGSIYCPLTVDLPSDFEFWGQNISQACRDISALRHLAASIAGVKVGDGGEMWLPIVWTARGPIYGEAIAIVDGHYRQPFHLQDSQRQPLYRFAYQLLSHLTAPPATYLLQFGLVDTEIFFDRLFPYPAEPALASIDVQTPDLFTCHWRCITQQPILDLYCV
jgi:hypothetical protein